VKAQTRRELLDLVKANYSAIAADFARDRQRAFWPELVKIITEIIPTEQPSRVLDVGCGNGRLFKSLPPTASYLGVDNSPELLEQARESNTDQRAVFKTGDILELNKLPEVNFSHIFAIAVLHHLPGRQLQLEALKQLKSKLAPDGRLVVTAWNLWSESKYRKLIWRFWFLKLLGRNKMDFGDIVFDWQGSKQPSRRYYHAFRTKELKKLARAAGLKLDSFSKDRLNYYLILKK